MSDDPNDRAARLAGRWGAGSTETDADEEGATDSPDEAPEADTSERTGTSADTRGAGDSADDTEGAEGSAEGAEENTGGAEESMERTGDDRTLTTREMQSQMLYLPPEFHKEVDLTFEELNLRFRRERDRKLEKNKDFYTGLLRLGLDRLGDVRDAELEELEELLDL